MSTMNLGKRLEKALEMAALDVRYVSRQSGAPAASISALIRRDSKHSSFTEQILATLPEHKVDINWVRSGVGTPEPKKALAPVPQGNKEYVGAPPVTPAPTPTIHSEAVGLAVSLKSWEHPSELPDGDWVFLPKLGVLYGNAQGVNNGKKTVLLKEDVQPFRAHWIRQGKFAPAGLAWHEAVDASMHPTICAGDSMVIDTQSQRPLLDGKTYAFWYGDALRPRRVLLSPNGGARLVPKNPEFQTIEVDRDELAALNILGRVVHREGSGEL